MKRICPICDHVMQRAHYCRFCKTWIAHPNYVNATYYLNERHPDFLDGARINPPSAARPVSGKAARPAAGTNARPAAGAQGKRAGGDSPYPVQGRPAGSSPAYSAQGRPALNRPDLRRPYGMGRTSPDAVKTMVIVLFVIVFALMFLSGFLPFLLFLF